MRVIDGHGVTGHNTTNKGLKRSSCRNQETYFSHSTKANVKERKEDREGEREQKKEKEAKKSLK